MMVEISRGLMLACNAIVWAFFVAFVSRSSGFEGAAVLRNFKLEACEGQSIDLTCPENTTISVGSLSLQRHETWKDEENIGCPPLPPLEGDQGSATNGDQEVPEDGIVVSRTSNVIDDADVDQKTGCKLASMKSRMLKTMARLCDNHRFCEAPVSAELLLGRYEGRPCRGQIKRMEVFYKCRPAVYQTKIVCEDEPFELQCNGRSRVMIVSTTFGRNPVGAERCPQKDGGPEESCDSDSPSMDIMTKLCDGRNKCGLIADPVVFADPCEERSSPFLTIVYACVPEYVLLNAEPMGADEIREDEHGNIIDPATTKKAAEPASTSSEATSTGIPFPTLVLNLEESVEENNATRRHLYFPAEVLAANYTTSPASNGHQPDMRRHIPHWNESIFPELCDNNVTKANHVIGVITEWLQAYQYILENLEKFILYLLLSVCIGLLLFCTVLICQLWGSNRRRARRLKRNKPTPTRNGSGGMSATMLATTMSPSTTTTTGSTPRVKIKTVASVGTVTNFPPLSSSSPTNNLLLDATTDSSDVMESGGILREPTTPRFGVTSMSPPSSAGSYAGPGRHYFGDRTPYGSAAVSPSSRAGLLAPLVEIEGNSDDYGDEDDPLRRFTHAV